MKRAILLAVLFLMLGIDIGHARIWIIRSNGSGQAPTIQAGIDSCATGDTVVAMPGVFTGDGNWDIDFKGKSIAVIAGRTFDPEVVDTTILDGQYPNEYYHYAFIFHSNEDSTSVLSGLVIRNFHWGGIWCNNSSPTILNNDISGHFGCIDSGNSSPRIIGNLLRNNRTKLSCYGGSPRIERNTCIGECDYDDCYDWMLGGCTALRIHGNTVIGIDLRNCTGSVDSNCIDGYLHSVPTLGVFNSTLTIANNSIGFSRVGALYCESSGVYVANNQMDGYLDMRESLPSRVLNNNIRWGEWQHIGGIRYDGDSTTVIEGNVIHEIYDGPGIECYSSIRIANNVIYSNGYGSNWLAGGIYCKASPLIEGNTIVGNRKAGILCASGSSPILRNNIIANNTSDRDPVYEGGIHSYSASITIECCNVYNNSGDNYVGIPDQTGLNGNISLDPIFCDAANQDYSIHALSPCAPGNHPGGAECGLIGALGVDCAYVATLLQSYRAAVEASAIVVRWELAPGAADDLRFVILRKKSEAGKYEERPGGAGILNSGTTFSYKDTGCEPGIAYRYRVDVVDEDGRRELFETETVVMPAMPLTLHQNHPNPFNPSTTIEYYLPEKAHVRLEIYDISGKRIVTLIDNEQQKGAHAITWNGSDNGMHPVVSGIYFIGLTAGKETSSRKMVLMR